MPATPEEKADAIAKMRDDGLTPPEVHRLTGIPRRTLADWARREGIEPAPQASAKTAPAREAKAENLPARRLELAGRILGDVERLRTQLFAPCVERKPMVVHQGKDVPAKVEIVEVRHDQPPFGDQQKIMVSIGIGVDKVLVLEGQIAGAPGGETNAELRDSLLAAARENGRHMNPVPDSVAS